MRFLGKLFTSDVETLKRKNKGLCLLEIVEKERLSPLGLEAIDAVGELRVHEALDLLRSLFFDVYQEGRFYWDPLSRPLMTRDPLLQRIAAAVARIDDSSESYLKEIESRSYQAPARGLSIAVLGQLKEAKAFDWMVCRLAAIGLDTYHDPNEADFALLLGRALGRMGDARAVDPLIVALSVAEIAASRLDMEPFRSNALAAGAALSEVLLEAFRVGPEAQRTRVPSALYSLLAARELDKADAMVARWTESAREAKRVEFKVQDETEASLKALWEGRSTQEGRDLFEYRLWVCMANC